MLRFVIRRRELDRGTGLATESLETVDAEWLMGYPIGWTETEPSETP